MKLVDRMEGVYEYRLETVVEAVVSGGLEDAWCDDLVLDLFFVNPVY